MHNNTNNDILHTPRRTFSILLFTCAVVFSFCFCAYPKESRTLLIARPVDLALDEKSRQPWVGALLEDLFYYKLSALEHTRVVPRDSILTRTGSRNNFSATVNTQTYLSIAREKSADYCIFQKYEAGNNKPVKYVCEVTDPQNNSQLVTIDDVFPIGSCAHKTDSILRVILSRSDITIPERLQRFFRFPVLGDDEKLLEQLGNVILRHHYGAPIKHTQLAQNYLAVSNEDSRMELAAFRGAIQYFKASEYDNAIDVFSNIHEVLPEYGPLYLPFTISLHKTSQLQEALKIARQGEKKMPNSIPLLLAKAKVFDKIGNRTQARKVYSEIRGIDSLNPHALLFLAREKLDASEPEKALSLAKKAAMKGGRTIKADILKTKAMALFALKRNEEAEAEFLNASHYAPEDASLYIYLGKVYQRLDNYTKAAEYYSKAGNYEPDNFSTFHNAAQAYVAAGNPMKALQIYSRIERKFPDNVTLMKHTGLLKLRHAGDTSDAFLYLQNAYELNRDDPHVMLALGRIYMHRTQYDDAFRMFNTILQRPETRNAARLGLACLYLHKKRPSQSLTYISEILKDTVALPHVNRYYGDAKLMVGDTVGAIERYNTEKKMYGTSVYLQQKLASLYYATQQWDRAEQEYKTLVSLSPQEYNAYLRLSLIYLHRGNVTTALEYWDKAEAQGKPDAQQYYRAATLLLEHNRKDQAITMFRECVSLNPQKESAWQQLARIYSRSGKDSMAAESYIKLYGIDSKAYSDELAQAGHLFFKIGENRPARDAYQLFLNDGNTSTRVKINLAHIEFANENFSRVITLLAPVSARDISDTRTHLILGTSYMEVEDYSNAIPPLKNTIEAETKNTDALRMLGLAGEKTGKFDMAAQMYSRLLEVAGIESYPDIAYTLGRLHEKNNNSEKAKAQYRTNIRHFPGQERHYQRLANLLFNESSYKECAQVIENALGHTQLEPGAKKLLARCYEQLDRREKAIEWYQKYLTAVTNDAGAWEALGALQFKNRSYAEAAAAYKEASRLAPDNFDMVFMQGKAYYKSNDYPKAAHALEKAHQLNTGSIEALKYLSRSYAQTGNTNERIDVLKKWISIEPKNRDIQLRLADVLMRNDRLREAADILTSASKSEKKNPQIFEKLVTIYSKLNDDKKLFHAARELAALKPEDPNAHYTLARYYLSHNDTASASAHLEKAVRFSDAHAPSQFEYAKLQLHNGNVHKAVIHFDRAIDLEPQNGLYLSYFAFAASRKGEMSKALGALSTAEKSGYGDDVDARCMAAQVYINADKTVQAKDVLRTAIKSNPDCDQCYEIIGSAYMREANYKHAVKALMKSWEIGGFDPSVLLKLSKSLTIDGKYEEAEDFLKMVLKKRSGNHEAVYRLAHIFLRREKLEDAQSLKSRYENREKTGWYHLMKGEIAEYQDEINTAFVSYNVAKRFLPENPVVYNASGRIFLHKDKYEKAIVDFSKALSYDPNNPRLQVNLAKAYKAKGDVKAAQELVSGVCKRFPHNVEGSITLAKIKAEKGFHRAAIALIEQALSHNPDNSQLYLQRGNIERALNQFDEAEKSYKKAIRKSGRENVRAYKALGDLFYESIDDSNKAEKYYRKFVQNGGSDITVQQRLDKLK